MANRIDPDNGGEKKGAATEGAEGVAGPVQTGGGKLAAWMPVLANIIIMPVLAIALTHFYILPKLSAAGGEKLAAEHSPEEGGSHGDKKDAHAPSKAKYTAPLPGKILVNVAGTMGTRYLIANITLVGNSSDLKSAIEGREPQLKDAASGILSLKTINDLEKPGIRNLIRTELISSFNDILGKNAVTEIYLTEFAIQ